jgi:predicted short-subunit dehydrogenase-like oxidoreductase (DUF2520 family)
MKKHRLNNFAIIGAGMVGTAIGFLLKINGYNIIAVADKSPAALKRTKSYIKSKIFRNVPEAVKKADVVLITTPDDTISSVSKEISLGGSIKDKFVFHMSGAGGLDLLETAKEEGAIVACIHPLQSFSSIDQAIINIPGSYFGITADKKALLLSKQIVRDLGGIPLIISPEQKPLYHAAACFASNYLVSLINTVEFIYQAIGINEKDAKKAYLPLVHGSLKNIETSGSISSLTGPIARGDLGTIRKHLKAIHKTMPQYSSLYSALGLATVKVAKQKGTLKTGQIKKINALLKGVDYEHSK